MKRFDVPDEIAIRVSYSDMHAAVEAIFGVLGCPPADRLRGLCETEPAPGHERVVYAGLPEHEAELDRRARGIPYHPDVIEWFRETADKLGLKQVLG